MSLVAYGNSDSEEDIEDQDECVQSCSNASSVPKAHIAQDNTGDLNGASNKSILTPIPKKQKETVQITIPSLEQFKEEDTDSDLPKRSTFKSGSGLLSMLPPPKHSVSTVTHNFKPYVLSKQKEKKSKPSVAKSTPKEVINSVTTSNISSALKSDPDSRNSSVSDEIHYEDQDASSPPPTDFFSLDSLDAEVDDGGNDSYALQFPSKSVLFSSLPDPVQSSSPCGSSSSKQVSKTSVSYAESEASISNLAQQNWNENFSPVTNEASAVPNFMEDEGFLKIKGKRGFEEVNIIDINGEDQLTSKDEWLMQSLTEEKADRPSKRRHGMPTSQQKRKHQITYLAFQAKERELDLKNQWAMNSLTRRETQAKYGF